MVFVTIWPTAHQTDIIVELAYGPKVALIRRGQEENLQERFKDIGIKIDVLEASHIAWVIKQHLQVF